VANVTAAAMQQYGLYPPMGPGPGPVALSQLERERLERLGKFILSMLVMHKMEAENNTLA
jgi:hypothetical protein